MANMGKHKIRVYDVLGNVVEDITRTIYSFNKGRTINYGVYLGVNYKNSRPKVYGDSEHPNGLYIFQGDFSTFPTEEIRARIHAQHTHDPRDVYSIGFNVYFAQGDKP